MLLRPGISQNPTEGAHSPLPDPHLNLGGRFAVRKGNAEREGKGMEGREGGTGKVEGPLA